MTIVSKLVALEKEAQQFGFNWERAEQILLQIQSECDEIKVHLEDQDKQKLQNEIGDLMHAVYSLCVFCQFNPDETLSKSIAKFERRFNLVKKITNDQGLSNLKDKTFAELMAVWDQAKAIESMEDS